MKDAAVQRYEWGKGGTGAKEGKKVRKEAEEETGSGVTRHGRRESSILPVCT